MSAWKVDPNKKMRSHRAQAIVSLVVTGCTTAILLLLFATYAHAPRTAKMVLLTPSMILHSRFVYCPEDPSLGPKDCPTVLEPNLFLIFGSFFIFYFILGAGVAAAVSALRRRFRKEGT